MMLQRRRKLGTLLGGQRVSSGAHPLPLLIDEAGVIVTEGGLQPEYIYPKTRESKASEDICDHGPCNIEKRVRGRGSR